MGQISPRKESSQKNKVCSNDGNGAKKDEEGQEGNAKTRDRKTNFFFCRKYKWEIPLDPKQQLARSAIQGGVRDLWSKE